MLYGIIMEWDAYSAPNGDEFPHQEFCFVSHDAESYLEVEGFQVRHEEEAEAFEANLREVMENGRVTNDGTPFKPMKFARRFFAIEEQRDGRRVKMDCRIWPPIKRKDAMQHGCLPEGTKYPNLGKEKAQTT